MIGRAAEIWPLFALMQPVGAAVFALDGILIGAGDTRFLKWSMLAALAAFAPSPSGRSSSASGSSGLGRPARVDGDAPRHLRLALRRAPVGRRGA
ncbi:hypothetical protein GBA65_12235 [Rubrobacter marinus]|uniref:Uncharacterized protein n=1 Tax=Rubrobacter marinus TaxID=2653852 RepID=A0A6G8PY51_9ACTN|nr:hypothetical protein [Rubrobacter marinus]QIN79162.1 hypothetical protein GBA65_12235 [Rubrobacter marinus]